MRSDIKKNDPNAKRELEKRLFLCKEKRRELVSSSKILFDLCKQKKIAYEEYLSRLNVVTSRHDFGEAIYALDHEIRSCEEKLKEYKSEINYGAAGIACFLLIVALGFSFIIYSNNISQTEGLAVFDIGNDSMVFYVNSFIPQDSMIVASVFDNSFNYSISQVMSPDSSISIVDNVSGYLVEDISFDLTKFTDDASSVTSSNVSIVIFNNEEILYAVNYLKSDVAKNDLLSNASSIDLGSNQINDSSSENVNSFVPNHVSSVRIGSTVFSVGIDKEVFNVGDVVNVSVFPVDSKSSIALVNSADNVRIIDGSSFVANSAGNFSLDVLITFKGYNQRVGLGFEVIGESAVSGNIAVDNVTGQNVSVLNINEDKDKKETVWQYKAEIGVPVKIVEQVEVKNSALGVLKVDIPDDASDIKIYKQDSGSENKSLIKEDLVSFEEKGIEYSPDEFARRKGIDVDVAPLITGRVVSDLGNGSDNVGVIVTDDFVRNDVLSVEYYIDGPTLIQEVINESLQRVSVSSNFSFVDVLTYVNIKEAPRDAIKLYHIENGSRIEVVDVEYVDSDKDGFIDKIKWFTLHLSTQVYEIEIIVMNLLSFKSVDDVWQVNFSTKGVANLSITPFGNTSFGEVKKDSIYTFDDLLFDSLYCGNDYVRVYVHDLNSTLHDYYLLSNIESMRIEKLVVPDYNCSGVSSLNARILSNETHVIE